jgi:RNA polymerase subunit RPABC4/transcription elongation factor Spt4
MNTCRNCNEAVNWNYCPNCGQPAKLKRIDGNYIIHEIKDFLLANKGMMYTIKRVLISPGDSVRHFLTEDRYRFVKPITFLFITSLIFTLVCHFFHFAAEDFYLQQPEIEIPTTNLLINWIIDYQGYASIIIGLFLAFFVKLFFRKSKSNLFEIFILLCFISGITSLFSSVIFILQGLTGISLTNTSVLITMIYSVWAIGQFFDKRKAASYIKAFLSCVLGFLIFGILVAFVGMFIDLVIKQ